MKMPCKMSTKVTTLERCFTVLIIQTFETTSTNYGSHICAHEHVFYLQLHNHTYPVYPRNVT